MPMPISCEKRFDKGQRFGVRAEWDFAHGRSDDRVAAVAGDEFGKFSGTAAFERQDSETGKSIHGMKL